MKTAVLCHSQTGFTERYAQWIASRIDSECFPLSKSRTMDLSTFDVLIFGTWMQAGNLHALADFVKIRKNNPDQPVFLFVTGAASSPFPDTLLALDEAGKALNTAPERVFYFPGGLNYSKMSLASRLMLKMLASMLKKKKDKSEQEEAMSRLLSQSCDFTDPSIIEPLFQALDALKHPETLRINKPVFIVCSFGAGDSPACANLN